jgi:hypothetical protein
VHGRKILYPSGIQFDYVNKSGELDAPDPFNTRRKQKEQIERIKKTVRSQIENKERLAVVDEWADKLLDKTTIPYAQFDEYYAQMEKLISALENLDHEPVNEGIKFAPDIAAIIASSNNVLPFPK